MMIRKRQPTLIVRPFTCLALLLWAAMLAGCALRPAPPAAGMNPPSFKYPPARWQTVISLPDDWQKTLVDKDGSLLYDYRSDSKAPDKFNIRITPGVAGDATWEGQELQSPRLPVVLTHRRAGAFRITEEAFAWTPKNWDGQTSTPALRRDTVIIHLSNTGREPAQLTPTVTVSCARDLGAITPDESGRLWIDAQTLLSLPGRFTVAEAAQKNRTVLRLEPVTVAPGGRKDLALTVTRARQGEPVPPPSNRAAAALREAKRFWNRVNLPYDRIQVPDPDLQALLDSCVRNIYQARELKNGLPAFQVGPTCYRGLWVVDGSFIMEAVTYLGRPEEARRGIEYLLSFQNPDGGFSIIKGHWKETGIVLWAVARHARLTGDRAWLAQQWPRLQRAVASIQAMRRKAAADAQSLSAGLLPPGFSDGGLKGPNDEYTNSYWTLAGLRSAVEAARWLGNNAEADAWQAEYDSMLAAFRRSAARDLRDDGQGHRYLPILMNPPAAVPRQKAQWAFLHAVYPGQVFAADDPLVAGNMAMLKACEEEGLVRDTGWLEGGLWTYFGSFYAHAQLWTGQGPQAAQTLYAFANHASPLLAWREEQLPQGRGVKTIGDMPHNWASAEMIRLTRHLLALERGSELHLLEGMPRQWAAPGAVTRLNGVMTEFGPLTLEVRIARDGQRATIRLKGDWRTPPSRILLHLGDWCGGQGGAVALPVVRKATHEVNFIHRGE